LLSTAALFHTPTLSAPVVQHPAGNTVSQVVTVQASHPTLAPAASGLSPQSAATGKAVAGQPLNLAHGDLGGVVNGTALSKVPVAADVSEPTQDWKLVPKLTQTKNACGTYSLAMIMDYLQGRTDVNAEDINHVIHRSTMFGASPSDLQNYAREHGLSAEMYNHSTIDELKGYLRQGYGVEVSISHPLGFKAPNKLGLDIKEHYVIVIGFEMRSDGEYVKIRDPENYDYDPIKFPSDTLNPDATYSMSLKDFKEKWGWPSDDGLRNFMIVYGKLGTSLPPSRLDGAEHSVGLAGVFTHLRDNWDRVTRPDDVGSWLHGAIALPADVPLLGLAGAGWGLSYFGKEMHDWGMKQPPGVSQVVTGVADVLDGAGKVLTQGSLGVSDALNHGGAAVEDLAKGHVADAISHAVQTHVDVLNAAAGIAAGAAQIVTAPLTGLGGVGKALGRAVSAPVQIGQTVVRGVGNVVGDVANALGHLGQLHFGAALRSVGQAAADAGEAIVNAGSDVVDAVGDAGKAVGDAVTTAWDWIFGGRARERPPVVDHRHH
jgi:predicted double-glycine peptidase